MLDVYFPIIEYSSNLDSRQQGEIHGESWREAIIELVEIRTGLMIERNPALDDQSIERLAAVQFEATRAFDQNLATELEGIAAGANVPVRDIVILNNYTDFRDIEVLEQGCSAIYIRNSSQSIAGQTWDMHRSAKRFVCCIRIPADDHQPEQIAFSVVGCLGMMGYASGGIMIGVNNLNTLGAVPGAVWPAVIRKLMQTSDRQQQREIIRTAPLTSGRSFLLADRAGGEFWEAMPGLQEQVSVVQPGQDGFIFHTNHCLSPQAQQRENTAALSSTTHDRFSLIEKKIDSVVDIDSAWDLLNDHEGYPKSICSNYQTSAQDPSVTCGGAVGDLKTGEVRLWRGDRMYDENFVEHKFELT